MNIILPILVSLLNFKNINLNSQIAVSCMQHHQDLYNEYAKITCIDNTIANHLPEDEMLNYTNKYQEYINNKKLHLRKSERHFIEKNINDNNNFDYWYQRPILIYDTASEHKYFNYQVKTDDTRYPLGYYVCENFAVAVASGADPAEFNSAENIKNHPALDYQLINDLHYRIAKEAYYFRLDQLSTVLKSITFSIYKEKNNTTKGYYLVYLNHGMAINITKEKYAIKIKFYDPNKTNIAKIAIISHPEDAEILNINDFISSWNWITSYFPQNKALLLSYEKTTKNSYPTVNVLSDISEIDLNLLLYFGHYPIDIHIKDSIIAEAMYGFDLAFHYGHFEAAEHYIDDLLTSNNSLEKKYSVLFSPYVNYFINDVLMLSDSHILDIFVSNILKNKHINNTEKIILLNKSSKKDNVFPFFFLPVIYSPDYNCTMHMHEKRLKTFKKLVNYILLDDNFTESEKIEIIKGKPLLDIFWSSLLIKNNRSKYYFSFLDTYLKMIFNSDKISEQTKIYLTDLDLTNIQKEIILYSYAMRINNLHFVFDYIEQIINSKLTLTAKKQLLKAKNKNIFSIIYKELKIIRPKLAELYKREVKMLALKYSNNKIK